MNMCVSMHVRVVVVGAAWEEQRNKRKAWNGQHFSLPLNTKLPKPYSRRYQWIHIHLNMCMSHTAVVASVIFDYSTTLINKVVITCCFDHARSHIHAYIQHFWSFDFTLLPNGLLPMRQKANTTQNYLCILWWMSLYAFTRILSYCSL